MIDYYPNPYGSKSNHFVTPEADNLMSHHGADGSYELAPPPPLATRAGRRAYGFADTSKINSAQGCTASSLNPSRFISEDAAAAAAARLQSIRAENLALLEEIEVIISKSSRISASSRQSMANPGKSMANPDPAGKSIHPILPQDVSRPSNVKFVRKNLKSADYLSPKKSVSLPSSWPKQKKRRHQIRQMSVFGSTGGKSAQHRGSQTGGKSAQRQNQPNPGLISKLT